MTMTADNRNDLAESTGRFTMYSLLVGALSFPTRSRLELLESKLIPTAQLLHLRDLLGASVSRLAQHVPTSLESARRSHTDLFPPIASQDAPGYETGYRGDGIFQQAAIMADIAGFYRAHGLRAGGVERERPDHIAVELEFMAFLAKKEALALQRAAIEQAEICRDTSALFLREHLGCWAPAFGRRTAAMAESPWLGEVGHLTAVWVEDELAAFAVEPVEKAGQPLPVAPPDDGACGPCPVGLLP